MKKTLFIIMVSILFILILTYFYDKREAILNRTYEDNSGNIHIEYPFFNRFWIDQYIGNYLRGYLEQYSDDLLFIDYDYGYQDQNVIVTVYIYKQYENVVKEIQKSFVVDFQNDIIQSDTLKEEKIFQYDFFYQENIDKNQPMVAFTFDDGPNHNTSRVLDILEKYHVKATFFVLGCNIRGNETIIKRMDDLGMEIGNHMYSHQLSTRMTNEEMNYEIEEVDQLLFNIIRKRTTLIRPSYGSYNRRIQKNTDKAIILWNVDTLDWKYHYSRGIYQKVIESVHDGDIILLHDIYSATANSLELIIPKLLEQNYQFVTVSELFYYKKLGLGGGKIYRYAK